MDFLKFWLYCSMFNVTFVSFWQMRHPVSDKAHRESLLYNAILGPVSILGFLIFIGFMSLKRLRG